MFEDIPAANSYSAKFISSLFNNISRLKRLNKRIPTSTIIIVLLLASFRANAQVQYPCAVDMDIFASWNGWWDAAGLGTLYGVNEGGGITNGGLNHTYTIVGTQALVLFSSYYPGVTMTNYTGNIVWYPYVVTSGSWVNYLGVYSVTVTYGLEVGGATFGISQTYTNSINHYALVH